MSTDTPETTGNTDRLRTERDELRSEVDALRSAKQRRGRLRRTFVALTILLSIVALTAGVVGIWARRNFLATDRFVDRTGQVIDDPVVQDALASRLTQELMLLIDPRELFQEALPERGQVLAVPLANAVEGFVLDRTQSFVASDEFAQLWTGAARVAHTTAIRVLKGDGELARDGQVTFNLLPAINAVLLQLTEASPDLVGRDVQIPAVTVDDIPDNAIARIEDAFGVELDEGFGQFTVYDHGRLETAQQSIRWFDRIVVTVLPIGLLFAGVALWLSSRRRRTLLQLCAGLAIGMVLVRRVSFGLRDEVASLPPTEQGRRAVDAALGVFMEPLTTFAALTLWGVAIIAAVAVLTGPYPWVVSLRGNAQALWTRTMETSGAPSQDETVVAWTSRHRDHLMLGGLGVGVVILWAADLSWVGVLVLMGLVAAFEVFVHRLGPPPPQVEPRSLAAGEAPSAPGTGT